MNNRHAYVILAHTEPEILARLVRQIDDRRNDIYIHLDAKSNFCDFSFICAHESKLIWTPRVKTYWGGPSLIKAEMLALKCAYEHGSYARYHLVSGVDFPIKSQDYIHNFCDIRFPDKEFVGYDLAADAEPEFRSQWEDFLVLGDFLRARNLFVRKISSVIRRGVVGLQRLFAYRRHPPFAVKKGTQWVSVTEKIIELLLSETGSRIYRFLLHSHCADEKLFQTLVWNSPYCENIFDMTSEMHSCMRKIDWSRGNPYVWRICDYDELMRSKCFFARKFSSDCVELVSMIDGSIERDSSGVVQVGRALASADDGSYASETLKR